MKKIKTSRSLMEVWEWKEDAFKEVMNLDIDDAIKKRLETSLKTTKAMGFHLSKPFKATDSKRKTGKSIGVGPSPLEAVLSCPSSIGIKPYEC